MELQRGTIFTPDKKGLLIKEIEVELSLLNNKIANKRSNEELLSIKESLTKALTDLRDKKGVVTPQETDNVLDLISQSKRLRLEGSYFMGMRRATFYTVAFVLVGVGIYFYNKKRG
jgi:hypothetical protein